MNDFATFDAMEKSVDILVQTKHEDATNPVQVIYLPLNCLIYPVLLLH